MRKDNFFKKAEYLYQDLYAVIMVCGMLALAITGFVAGSEIEKSKSGECSIVLSGAADFNKDKWNGLIDEVRVNQIAVSGPCNGDLIRKFGG